MVVHFTLKREEVEGPQPLFYTRKQDSREGPPLTPSHPRIIVSNGGVDEELADGHFEAAGSWIY